MNATYPVEWKRIFKSLTIYMSIAIIVPIVLFMCVRFVSRGFDYEKALGHMSIFVFLVILVCAPLFSAATAFMVSLWFRIVKITILDRTIIGRNYWGFKNRIPLSDITKLTPFNSNGIKAIVVHSGSNGKIYISCKTARLSELLTILNENLPEDQKIDDVEQFI